MTARFPLLLLATLWLFQFLYFGYFWSRNGQSLGMNLVNIRVRRRGEGDAISFWRRRRYPRWT